MFKTEPLKRLIARYVDDALLERIGVEYKKGRRLLVVTTNLDAQRTAVWDMGAIAASGAPDALNLFRDVLVASASVPGVYSPVLINVEGEGRRFEEMHVDGGVRANLLVVPESLLLSSVPPPASGVQPRVYIVMNNKLEQDFEIVEGKALTIVSRSFTTAVKANTQNTLIATYDFARRNKWDFNLASIDAGLSDHDLDGLRPQPTCSSSISTAMPKVSRGRRGARACRRPTRCRPLRCSACRHRSSARTLWRVEEQGSACRRLPAAQHVTATGDCKAAEPTRLVAALSIYRAVGGT